MISRSAGQMSTWRRGVLLGLAGLHAPHEPAALRAPRTAARPRPGAARRAVERVDELDDRDSDLGRRPVGRASEDDVHEVADGRPLGIAALRGRGGELLAASRPHRARTRCRRSRRRARGLALPKMRYSSISSWPPVTAPVEASEPTAPLRKRTLTASTRSTPSSKFSTSGGHRLDLEPGQPEQQRGRVRDLRLPLSAARHGGVGVRPRLRRVHGIPEHGAELLRLAGVERPCRRGEQTGDVLDLADPPRAEDARARRAPAR